MLHTKVVVIFLFCITTLFYANATCTSADFTDANNDGVVDALDVQLCVNAFLAEEDSPDINGDGSVNSLDVQLIVNAFFGLYVDPPTNLSASAVLSSQINLTWQDNATNETGFTIERAHASNGPWSEIETVGENVSTYPDTELSASTYYYRVRAYRATVHSDYSNIADATCIENDSWVQVPTGDLTDDSSSLHAVWSWDSANVWVTAYNAVEDFLHWNGSIWSGWDGAVCYDIWGSGPNDVWTIGSDRGGYGMTLHWNGAEWTQVENPLDPDSSWSSLHGVWGSSANDVWAVGATDPQTYNTIILHWDGDTWSTSPVNSRMVLTDVWGNGPDDVWAVGAGGGILHWDGTTWSRSRRALYGQPHLKAVWGSSTNDVWAVGDRGEILHWDGSTWSAMNGITTTYLNGIWGASSDDVWVVGISGDFLHWDGSSWSEVTVTSFNIGFYAIYGSSSDNIWAVGQRGTVLHYVP